jgi:hypothetical protein
MADGLGRGDFFVVDARCFKAACDAGVNAGIAYLVLARGTGADQRATAWSVNAIEQRTGMGRQAAANAIAELTRLGLLRPKRGGTRPLRLLSTAEEAGLARIAGKPALVFLPNALVDGAASERPPLALLRQAQEVTALRLLVDIYRLTDLAEHGGVSRRTFWQAYDRKVRSRFHGWVVWRFEPAQMKAVLAAFDPRYNAPGKGRSRAQASQRFWGDLQLLRQLGLVEVVPHLFESASEEGALIHPAPLPSMNLGTEAEMRLGNQAHAFACALLGHDAESFEGELLLPVPAHIQRVELIGILRPKYRARTAAASRWHARVKDWDAASYRYFSETQRLLRDQREINDDQLWSNPLQS